MIIVIGFFVGLFCIGVGFALEKITRDNDGINVPFLCIGFIAVGVSIPALFLGTAFSYSSQIEDKYALLRTYEVEAINKDKANTLTTQFATYLYEAYPQHEKDIFNKIQPESIDIYLVKYPELKASATIIKLVENISTLQTDYYDQKILRAKIKQDMLYRKHSPWVIKSIIPEYTGD